MPATSDNLRNAAAVGMASAITHASLHTAYSGLGANEVTGGSPAYARKIPLSVVAGTGINVGKVFVNGLLFDVPGGTTVSWVGLWGSAGFLGMVPNLGLYIFKFVGLGAGTTVYAPNHNFTTGDRLVVWGALTEGTIYWVTSTSSGSLTISTTEGGSAVSFGVDVSGFIQRITPWPVALQSTFSIPNVVIYTDAGT